MLKLFASFSALLAITFAVLFVCNRPGQAADPTAGELQAPPVKTADIHGFDPANMDKSASACTNFFQYADGGWVERNPVPPAFARWGKFEELAQKNQMVLRDILEAAAKNTKAKPKSLEQKVGDFYSSCMDESKVDAAGIKPLEPEFQRISAIKDLRSLEDQIARMHSLGLRGVFGFGAAQDFKKSTDVIAQAVQGGIGLPDRDYYTKDDDRSKQIRDEYVNHVAKMFALSGDTADVAATESKTVFGLEKKLAEVSKTRIERRDPAANYHKMQIAELN